MRPRPYRPISTSDPPVSRYGRTDLLWAAGIISGAHIGAWIALQFPIPRPGGSELATAALLYVWFAAVVGIALVAYGLSPVRAFLTAYLAMGSAAALTLGYVAAIAFPDGYVKIAHRLIECVLILVATNLVAGFTGLLIGARLDVGRALAGTVFALFAAPAVILVLLAFALAAGQFWSALTRAPT